MSEKEQQEHVYRIAVQSYHFCCPHKTSENCTNLLRRQFRVIKTAKWVRDWWSRASSKRKVGTGLKKKFNVADKRKIIALVHGFKKLSDGSKRRKLSVRKAAAKFYLLNPDNKMSKSTITNIIKASELNYRHLGEKSLLRKIHIEARKKLVMNLEGASMNIVFTDSTKFELQRYTNRRNDGSYVYSGEEVPADAKVKHPVWFHVYGSLCKYGLLGPYYVSAGVSINAELYSTQILPVMIRDLKKIFGDEEFTFQQDGAGAHFAKKSTEFLIKKNITFWKKGFWPGNSADLSPIENVWSVLKLKIFDKGTPNTVRTAKSRIKKFFRNFEIEKCEKLVNSFWKRVEELKTNGYGVLKH